jgi:thiamine-phosphate pyrophosphorylase
MNDGKRKRIIHPVDWGFYLVTDSRLLGDRALLQIVSAAVDGGAKVVQYRDKDASTRCMVETAWAMVRLCREKGVCLLVNDRVDVALAVDADGVHVGQEDMPAGLARRLIGPDRLLGVSVHDTAEINQAERDGADYVSLSPIFATPTKPDHQEPLGLDGIRRLAAASRLPVVAIGGIHRNNAAQVIRAGAVGICVVSAIIAAADPEEAARELRRIVAAAHLQAGSRSSKNS